MKRGELINKGIAAVTVGFMAVVRPDPMPSMFETALITVLMYEVVRWCACGTSGRPTGSGRKTGISQPACRTCGDGQMSGFTGRCKRR